LVENVPTTDNIEDALSKFDDILLEEGNSSFSDVHMIHCQCPSPVNLPGLDDKSMELNEEDGEYGHDPFHYEMLDGARSQDLQQQAREVSFDDMVRGLLAVPPDPYPEPSVNPVFD
ncbi:unnamed protein product, partial [Larinioides sclopetarius]